MHYKGSFIQDEGEATGRNQFFPFIVHVHHLVGVEVQVVEESIVQYSSKFASEALRKDSLVANNMGFRILIQGMSSLGRLPYGEYDWGGQLP